MNHIQIDKQYYQHEPSRYNWNIVESGVKHHMSTHHQHINRIGGVMVSVQ